MEPYYSRIAGMGGAFGMCGSCLVGRLMNEVRIAFQVEDYNFLNKVIFGFG